MRKAFCMMLGLLASTVGNTQNILSFIPKKCSQVSVVDGSQIDAKYQYDELLAKPRFIDFEEGFEEGLIDSWRDLYPYLIYTGHKHGVNSKGKYYLYQSENDSIDIKAFVFELTDNDAWTSFLEEKLSDKVIEEKKVIGEFSYIFNVPYAIVWNNNHLIIYHGSVQYGYLSSKLNSEDDYYMEELTEKERTEKEHQIDVFKEKVLTKDLARLVNMNFESTILSDKNFMSLLSGDFDVMQYQNEIVPKGFGNNMRTSSNDYGYYDEYYEPEFPKVEIPKNPLLENNYGYTFWKLDKQNVTSKSYLKLNKELYGHLKRATNGKLNKDFFKYIKGDDILGYYALAISPKGTYEMLDAVTGDVMQAIPGIGGGMKSGMEIFMALIDKKKALNIVKGDVLFAVTDQHEVDVRYESYTYNEEDFIRERLIKTKKEMRPEFIFMASFGEEDIVRNYLLSMANKGKLFDMGNYYRIVPKKNYNGNVKDAKVDSYIAFDDGILLITNNESIISDHLGTGFDKSERISKEWIKRMTAHNISMYWDLSHEANPTNDDNMMALPKMASAILRDSDSKFTKIEMTGLTHLKDRSYMTSTFDVDKDEEGYARFGIIAMLTGVSQSLNPLKF